VSITRYFSRDDTRIDMHLVISNAANEEMIAQASAIIQRRMSKWFVRTAQHNAVYEEFTLSPCSVERKGGRPLIVLHCDIEKLASTDLEGLVRDTAYELKMASREIDKVLGDDMVVSLNVSESDGPGKSAMGL